jgi:hypothetical protein
MNLRSAVVLVSSVLLISATGLSPSQAQQKPLKDQLVGSWSFVSGGAKLPDGSSVWGSNPKGLLVFTENGSYSSQILRSDRPKFSANSRTKGTDQENRAAVHGSIASFGTYTVNEADKSFTVRFEGSSYPNQEGTQQIRPVTIQGDELRITNPSPTVGGPPSQLIYKRVK